MLRGIPKKNLDFFPSMSKIIDGNKNEVSWYKISKNEGFFEKFFDFFQ